MAEKVRLSGLPDEHTHYQIDLTGGLDRVYLLVSGWPKQSNQVITLQVEAPLNMVITGVKHR
jgi:hypothetical protein